MALSPRRGSAETRFDSEKVSKGRKKGGNMRENIPDLSKKRRD